MASARLPCCPPVNRIGPPATGKNTPCNPARDRVVKLLIYSTLSTRSRAIFKAESIFHPDFARKTGEARERHRPSPARFRGKLGYRIPPMAEPAGPRSPLFERVKKLMGGTASQSCP